MQDADFEASILERMAVVEKAIRLQMSLGASHLQQVEMAPETFGLPATARTHVRNLRRKRNDALHCLPQVARDSDVENAALEAMACTCSLSACKAGINDYMGDVQYDGRQDCAFKGACGDHNCAVKCAGKTFSPFTPSTEGELKRLLAACPAANRPLLEGLMERMTAALEREQQRILECDS